MPTDRRMFANRTTLGEPMLTTDERVIDAAIRYNREPPSWPDGIQWKNNWPPTVRLFPPDQDAEKYCL